MADITLSYKGSTIGSISASGTSTLQTAGMYCEDDITLDYVKPSGGSLKMGVMRSDATLVQSYSYDKKIHADEGVTIPSYTTTSQTLKASADLSPTVTFDFTTYNYYVLIRALTIPTYSVTSKAKGRMEYAINTALYEVAEFAPSTFATLVDPSKKATSRSVTVYAVSGNRCIYWSSASAVSQYTGAAYGPNQTIQAPGYEGGVLTPKSPALIVRGSTSYFTNTYMNALTDIRYQYKIEVYRVTKGNLNLDGWGIWQQVVHGGNCASNGGTLT